MNAMHATAPDRKRLRDFITVKRHAAAEAAEALFLDMEDDGPCTAADHAKHLREVERLRYESALALEAEATERQLAA